MSQTKINYDRDADVLYVSFGRSQHITGVELTDNVLLRLDTGKSSGESPRAIGLTFISFAHVMEIHRDRLLLIPLVNRRGLPEALWQVVLAVVTTPPVMDFLSVRLILSLKNLLLHRQLQHKDYL